MRVRYTEESISALLEKTASLFSIFKGPGTIIWVPLFTVLTTIWKSCIDFSIIFKLLKTLWTKNAMIYIVQSYHILILNLTLWELWGFSVACIIMQSSLCIFFLASWLFVILVIKISFHTIWHFTICTQGNTLELACLWLHTVH